MTYKQSWTKLSAEVKSFDSQIRKQINKTKSGTQYYKGTAILYSPLIHKPKILILGINPGDGYFYANGNKPVASFTPLKIHEYIEEDYRLASEMKSVFSRIGYFPLLEKSVKSNIFYFSTHTESELHALAKSLPEDLQNKLYSNSFEWTSKLIDLVSPDIILCEGKSAFDWLEQVPGLEITNVQRRISHISAVAGKYKIIACRRLFSNILYKDQFSRKLKNLIES